MKQRFSSLDVKVIASELSTTLTSLRISNIYDLSSRIFLFKCAKPGSKAQLLVDSGFRCHLTSFSRTANPAPSAFVSRLRKYLKSRRITSVKQLGTDRVIELSFSDGQYRLFLEFFAAGNIILTDADLNVLALLRQVSEGDEDVDVKLGGKYVLEAKQNFHGIQPVTEDRIRDALNKAIEKTKAAQEIGGKKAKRSKGSDDVKRALSAGFSEFPVHIIDHVLTETDFDATKKPETILQSTDLLDSLKQALNKASELFESLQGEGSKGYIIAKEKDQKQDGTEAGDTKPDQAVVPSRDKLLYDDFHPFRPSQFEGKPGLHILEIDGFNKAVDEFFSSIESQKLESRLTEKEEAAKKKLDAAKNEHEKRLGALKQVQELHIRKAQTIEANTHRVEEATAAVNGLIGQGMDWVDIGKLIENEQKRNNIVAQMIKLPLKLYENTVTLLLDEPGDEEEESEDEDKTDSEEESDDEAVSSSKEKAAQPVDKQLAIDIDLGISPWANARQYYDQKKTAAVKEQKTVQASAKAIQSIEKKNEADLKKGLKQEKASLRPSRKQFWFEKFHYFISSDGYLVLGGKDAQQNELLYRRYLKKGDIYVHADLTGASSVIVKNNPTTPDAPIPPSTLSQAGALTVCTSSAWDSKAVMAAYWVNSDQVSKTAPTGEYIKTGGFMIKGKKNFLPPTQLILGFGAMWLISEESRTNHGKHRLQRTESMLDGEAEALAADAQGLSIDEDAVEANTEQSKEVVPDVEDAGEEAAKEIEDNEAAAGASDDHDDDNDEDDYDDDNEDDDKGSIAASEKEQARSNPLQASNINDHDSEVDDEENEELQNDSENEDVSQQEDNSTTPASSVTPSAPAKTSQKQRRPKRGKNTKAKRAAMEKYALQTEEERELALSLLGSTKGQQKKEDEAAARAAREAKSLADKERRRAQHQRAAEAEKRRMERLAKGDLEASDAAIDEEQDAEQLEQERKELLNIDLLIPYPEPGDELVAAIPIVAPWAAMARHKFKVKLQPGSLKKGKAVKEIVGNWTNLATRGPKVVDETNRDKEKVWAREMDCLKQWRVEEVVGAVPVKGVRLVQSGGGMAGGGGGAGGKGKGNPARGGKGGKKR